MQWAFLLKGFRLRANLQCDTDSRWMSFRILGLCFLCPSVSIGVLLCPEMSGFVVA